MAVCKKEFADRMAENGGITKKAAFEAVGLFIDTLIDYLSEDEKVLFTGFGKFEIRTVKEKKGRNPKTGVPCIIPEHEYVGFRASDLLYDEVMGRKSDNIYETER